MDKLFVCLAIALAKTVTILIQLTGLGMASSLPGKLAYKIYPSILPYLAKQLSAGCLAITGTNGKSTTAGLLASILKEANYKVIHNKQGANLIPGIITAFIRSANWNGHLKGNFGLLEVDEAALPLLAKEINCQIIVVTNLFRDQLDRYGELDKTARLITQGLLEQNSLAVLNADDPNVCNLPCTGKKIFYGVSQILIQANSNLEISYCPKCGHEINYSSETSFNIWYCPNCVYKRPNPDLFVDQIELMSSVSKFVLHINSTSIAVDLPLPGIFNIYNAAAASAAAYCVGINSEIIKQGLEKYETLFGRSEKLSIDGRNVIIQLIKIQQEQANHLSHWSIQIVLKYLLQLMIIMPTVVMFPGYGMLILKFSLS